MQVKICGITKVEDALAAIDAGADFLGFNFYPKSPRYLTVERCTELTAAVHSRSSAICVGIFVNETIERIEHILRQCHLDLAQLHGEETPAMVAAFNGRAFKAFRGTGERHAEYAAARLPLSQREREGELPVFLVDAYSPTHYGGTGHTADWVAAQPLAAQYPLLLAGGLTPENVAEAVQQVHPWGVDVASGVERAPGVKDPAKVKAFVRAAKNSGKKGN